MGPGFHESVYQEALEIEFENQGIDFEREAELRIVYCGSYLKKKYIADFICYGCIIVELKAISNLTDEHTSQVLNYLKATELELGLLVNFGEKKLHYKRIIL